MEQGEEKRKDGWAAGREEGWPVVAAEGFTHIHSLAMRSFVRSFVSAYK